MSMTLIPDDAHVMLAAAVSTKNVILIADTIMCITDLVSEIQSRFTVVVKPGMARAMTFGASRIETPVSFPCSTCDRKFSSAEDLNAHAKKHTIDEDVRSATQRLHSLTSSTVSSGGAGDQVAWPLQSSNADTKPVTDLVPSSDTLDDSILDHSKRTEDSADLKCPICSKVFKKIFLLNIHLTKHQTGASGAASQPNRTYKCRLCSKEFNHISNRAKHERICKLNSNNSSASKPPKEAGEMLSQVYSCRKCKKPYADNANRLRHERLCQTTNRNRCLAYTTLSPTKPTGSCNSLELPISVNNYKQMASSATYMKVLDEHGKQTNMFSCIICAKLLQTRTSLESHYMSHLGIKPHACQFCGKRFTDSSNWRKHQRGCTERSSDMTPTATSAPIAPPMSTHTAVDGPLSNEYSSVSTSPTSAAVSTPTSAAMSVDDSYANTVKIEAVDITSDNECGPAAHLQFSEEQTYSLSSSDDQARAHLSIPSEIETADANQPLSAVCAEVEESEEQRDINTANSVVVDSALSWFVTDKDAEKLSCSPSNNQDS